MKQGTMDFNLANGNTNTPITSFEVQGAIHDANDLLLSDTHVVYVNRTNSARFSGVYIVTFNYGDPGKQHPSASQRHFQVSTSARLSWGNKAHTQVAITVRGSPSIMCISLEPGSTPSSIFPRLVFPDMDSDDPKNSVMLNELSTAYFGAELDGNDFLSGNFCHEVSNGVYESTVSSIKWFNYPFETGHIYFAEGDFIYSFNFQDLHLVIKSSSFREAEFYGCTINLFHLATIRFKDRRACFLDLNRARVLHLGGCGPAAFVVINGRMNSQDYLCYIWIADNGESKICEYVGDRALEMRPEQVHLAYATKHTSVVMTDKATYYVKR